MKKMTSVCLMAWVLLGTFAVANLNAQTTIQRSLYVSAKGNDNNNGRSEETPYKTLRKAVETANAGVIKTITVIGTIEESISINQTGADEILITGKPDASFAERAVISSFKRWDETVCLEVYGKIRFTYIQITSIYGLNSSGITIILGAGAVVSNPSGVGISSVRGLTLIMTDDSTITGCKGDGVSNASVTMSGNTNISNNGGNGINGITVTMSGNASITNNGKKGIDALGATITMSDNAKVSDNKDIGVVCTTLAMSENAEISGNRNNETFWQDKDGGGTRVNNLTMSGNAKIINNSTKGNGGGASVSRGGTISGNASISGNTAKGGGGLYISDGTLIMEGGEISGNKAENGAGVYVEGRGALNHKSGIVTGNEADFVGGGVYVKSGSTYTAGGGKVTGNTSGDMGDDNVFRQ